MVLASSLILGRLYKERKRENETTNTNKMKCEKKSEKEFFLYLETNVWCVIKRFGEVKIFLDQGGGGLGQRGWNGLGIGLVLVWVY